MIDEIRTDLGVGLGKPFNYYLELLDQSRFPDKQSLQLHFDFMRRKYADSKIDLIVAIGPRILPLISRYATPRFNRLPTLCMDLESGLRDSTAIVRKPNTTAIVGKFDLKKTVETALSLHPTTRSIYVIAGVAPVDRFYEAVARRVFLEYEDKIRVTYLSGLTMEELLEKVGSLPGNGIMIYLSFYEDAAGKKYIPRESLKVISGRSKVPVYGFVDSYIGYGIVGGYVLSVERIGAKAGELALRILRGEHPDALPVIREGLNLHMFDWRELKRWGVNENILPRGSVIVNRVPTLWEQHKGFVIGSIAAFLAQTLLVSGLLIQRSLKKKAESSLRESEARFRATFEHATVGIAHVSPEGRFLRINPKFCDIVGYSPAELLERTFRDVTHPDDLGADSKQRDRLLRGEIGSYILEKRYVRKDGAVGDAYSVLTSGAEAVFWNPAGVALSDRSEASLTYLKWIFDTQQGAVSFSTPLGNLGSVGVQVQYVDFGEIPEALWDSPFKDDIRYPRLDRI